MGEVDLVIDHHPEETPTRARLRDVRPSYGATSTILTEYLRAADVKIRERLATALLYGIKTDTLHLERGATRADMEAFAYLHAHANHNALRRIERPDLPEAALDVLAKGIARRRLVDGVMLVHLGVVGYPELVAQFADLLLQVEGAEWSVVSGRIGSASCTSRCATSGTCGRPATWCTTPSASWGARAATGRWPRRWCGCATGGRRACPPRGTRWARPSPPDS